MVDDSFFELGDLPPDVSSGPGARPWEPPVGLRPRWIDLGESSSVLVGVGHFVSGSDGFGFFLRFEFVNERDQQPRDVFDVVVGVDEPVPLAPPDSLLRFGVAYPDGSKSTNLDGKWDLPLPQEPPVLQPLQWSLSRRGGVQAFWMWPLPPPGKLTFVVAWPAEGLSVAATDVNVASVL